MSPLPFGSSSPRAVRVQWEISGLVAARLRKLSKKRKKPNPSPAAGEQDEGRALLPPDEHGSSRGASEPGHRSRCSCSHLFFLGAFSSFRSLPGAPLTPAGNGARPRASPGCGAPCGCRRSARRAATRSHRRLLRQRQHLLACHLEKKKKPKQQDFRANFAAEGIGERSWKPVPVPAPRGVKRGTATSPASPAASR